MSALIVGAMPSPGEDEFYRGLLRVSSVVVAADAAGEWCVGLGRVPDVVVGDFDSASIGASERLAERGAAVVRAPTVKDETDLELAVQLALGRFKAPLTLTCAFTDRMDHTLAAFGALLSAGRGAMVREPSWSAWLVLPESPVSVELESGQRFSVLAALPSSGVTVSGGRWKLERADLPPLSGRGVRNVAMGGQVDVSCCGGAILVLLCDQA